MAERKSRGRGGNTGAAGGVGGLVGPGPSIVGLSGSMRARDVSRIREQDLARAERTVVLRRRPPEEPSA